MGSSVKKGVYAACAFFCTFISLSVGYAALTAGLTSGDIKSVGDQVSLASWNRMVNSILELDTRTATPVVTKISGTFGSATTNIPNNTWTYIGDSITLTPGNWVVYYSTFYDTDGTTPFNFSTYTHPFLSSTTAIGWSVSQGNLSACSQNYCPIVETFQVTVPSTATYYVLHLINSYGGSYVRIRGGWGNFYAIKTN